MKSFFQKLRPYKDIIENVISLAVVFAVIYLAFRYFNLSDVQSFVDRFGFWAPIIFILTKAATIVFAPLSGSPLYPAAGALFGFQEGFIILMIGDIIGGSIAFFIARAYGVRIVERFVKSESSLMKKVLDQLETLKGYIFARICFSPMPEIVCYAAGLTKMSYLQFIVIHIIVDAPMTAILVGAGALFAFDISPIAIFWLFLFGSVATAIGGYWFYKKTK